VVELGSQDVNGSLREHCPEGVHYIGLDVIPAKGVDLIVDPSAPLPLATGTADAIVTSSAFEHDICFWDTFLELTRILRPGGLLYVNVPSNGDFHRYPLDCWRFYPDAGVALVRWAGRRGIEIELIESFIGLPKAERWADFVAVFRRAGGTPLASKGRISDHVPDAGSSPVVLKSTTRTHFAVMWRPTLPRLLTPAASTKCPTAFARSGGSTVRCRQYLSRPRPSAAQAPSSAARGRSAGPRWR
jgi:SAM-dependent methyltransferase